jgi:phage host-nuclease inhibitor protein Gam
VLAIMEQGKRKTLSLPSGDIQARNQPDRVEVVDETVALDFLQANHPDAVRVKTVIEIDKSAVKKLFADGIAVPGCDLLPGAIKYSIVPEVQLVKPSEGNHDRIDV